MQKSDWKKCKLGDTLNFHRGYDLPKDQMTGQGYPVVGSNGIIGYHDEYTTSAPCLVIGRSGNTGKPAIYNYPCWAHNTTLYVDDFKGNSPQFLCYLLKTMDLGSYAAGSAVPTLNRNHIHPLEINLPPIEEQKRIAQILGALDDKIELLQKQNKTLEDMAKAIFKSWFVDFDVVHAKQKGLPKADIMREYHLTDELYDLFPSDFESSSLGPIPSGWQVKKAQEIANITIGRTPPRKETEWFSTNSSDVTWISIKDLGNGSVFISDSSEYLTQEAVSKFRIPIIPAKTVVLSFKLTVGRVAITTKNMCSNEAIAQFQDSSLPITYLYLLLKHINFSLLGSTSSIATAINSNTIKSMNMLVATKGILLAFDNQTQYLFNKIEENLKQIQTLTELRDTLLPPLISGKIRV